MTHKRTKEEFEEAAQKSRSIAAKRERGLMPERQSALEEEIKRMFPQPQKIKIASKEE